MSGAAPPNTHLQRAGPRPAPCHYTAAWKAGHKRECAPGLGAANAALIQRAARPATLTQAGLTKEQRRLGTRLDELQEADDWRGIAALEREALALARVADPSLAGVIHSMLGNAYQSLGDFSRAIEHHTQHLAIAKEVGDRAGEGSAYGNLGNADRKSVV